MTRWSLTIQEYVFTIKYIKGGENKIGDTLSRYAIGYVEPHEAQSNDIEILAIK